MKNNYEIRGDVTAIFLKYKGKSMETLIDTEDILVADKLTGTWNVVFCKIRKMFYVMGCIYGNGKSKTIRLHRLILNAKTGKVVDHKDHNTLNNTKKNLREVTNAQNQQNKKGAYATSKSGIRGIFKRNNSWLARVKLNSKVVYEKQFKNINDAEKAVKEARKKLLPYATN